jgi:iron uptake system component EfeO
MRRSGPCMRQFPARRRLAAVLVVAGSSALALTGCSGDDKGSADPGAITVTATDDDCRLATAQLPAGTHVFRVKNEGSRVTEFYVYGDGDRVVGEVEDIAPGVSRDLHVKLSAGKYEAACKPGMEGDGIRRALSVTGKS